MAEGVTHVDPEEAREIIMRRYLLPFWSGESSCSTGTQYRGLRWPWGPLWYHNPHLMTFESGPIDLDVPDDAEGRVLKFLGFPPCNSVSQEWSWLAL